MGVPIIRTVVDWGLFWGTHYFGKETYLDTLIRSLRRSKDLVAMKDQWMRWILQTSLNLSISAPEP